MLWVAWMIMGRFDGASHPFGFTANAVWWVLILGAGAAVATATSPYPALHRSAMAASSAIYVAVLATHTVLLLAGNDVLAPLALGDYGGLPLLMLACAFSGQWVVPAAAVVLVDSVLTNHNVVDAGAWHQLLAVAHSLFLLMPFLYFLYTASRATQATDRLAARTLGTSLELAKQGWLMQNRARFLGYIHDQVLPVLAGIPMGVSTLADLDHLPEAFEGGKSGTVELALVVRTWSTTFGDANPGVRVVAEDPLNSPACAQAGVPRMVFTVMTEALLEAVANARKYAGGAPCTLRIRYETGAGAVTCLSAEVIDAGPGFDPGAVMPGRAGIRIAIIGRMAALAGGEARVDSELGRGTRVWVAWDARAASRPDTDVSYAPNPYELLGFQELLRPCAAVGFFIFTLAMSASAWPQCRWLWYTATLFCVAVNLYAIFTRPSQPTPFRVQVLGALSTAGVLIFGGLSQVEPAPEWPQQWYVHIALLLAAYQVLRGSTVVALVGWVFSLTIQSALISSGRVSEHTSAAQLALRSLLLIAAALLPLLVRQVAARIPTAVNQGMVAGVESGLAVLDRQFSVAASAWLGDQLDVVRADPTLVPLLQQRLRDCISAPALDIPELTAAVWSARERGSDILLIDDRWYASLAPLPVLPDDVAEQLFPALERCGVGGSLTLRMYPPGRETVASVRMKASAVAKPELVRVRARG